VKRLLAVLAVAAAGAFVLLRPAPAPVAPATGWSTAARIPGDGRFAGASGIRGDRGRAGPAPAARALVYVAGEVVKPGVYPVAAEARVTDALALAGGTRPDADLVAVNLAAHVADGDEVVVPARGEAARATVPRRHAKAHGARRSTGPRRSGRHKRSRAGSGDGAAPGEGLAPAAPVDINTADAQTLATVPGIGGGLAERIVAFRAANGPFASVDELLDVSGITDRRLEAIVPFVVAR
jgi:competence protein ComEA